MAIAQEVYLESTVLCADRLELVQILYQAAVDAVEKARRHLRQGEIAARSRQISRALAILTELVLSINPVADTGLGRNLAELYDYMQRRLIEANIRQADAPLGEVSRLLASLLDAWLNCKPAPRLAPLPADPELRYAPQTWSM